MNFGQPLLCASKSCFVAMHGRGTWWLSTRDGRRVSQQPLFNDVCRVLRTFCDRSCEMLAASTRVLSAGSRACMRMPSTHSKQVID